MNEKKERLNEAYEHLRKHFGIHTKKDFAIALKIKQAGLYSAMSGNELYLTKSLFQKICAAFPGVFDLNYLLTGEGHLLTIEEEVKSTELSAPVTPQPVIPDYVQRLCDEAARIATRSEMLERSLSHAVAESRELKDQLAATVQYNCTLRQQLSEAVAAVTGMKSQMDMLLGLFRVTPDRNRIIIPQHIASEPAGDYTTAPPLTTYDDGGGFATTQPLTYDEGGQSSDK